ncbi:MAG: YceD family protein [Negativibacillus sp.]
MQLDLKKLFESGDHPLDIQYELDLSDLEQWGEKPFRTPVALCGQVVNRAGIVTLTYTAALTYSTKCARCLEPIRESVQMKFTHTVVQQLNQESDDDYIVVENGVLDMDELATDDISLELPIRVLCSEDCKGLCPICGVNLNKTTCDCEEPQWTPGHRNPFKDLL